MHNIQKTTNNENAYRDVLKYIVGSLMIEQTFRFISKKALFICKEEHIYNPTPTKKFTNLNVTIEHSIPISLITDYLINLNNTEITPQKIFDIVKSVRGTSLITKDENDLLRNKKLQSALPNGYTIDMLLGDNPTINFDIRYKAAGIE